MKPGFLLLLASVSVLSCSVAGRDDDVLEQSVPEINEDTRFVPGSAEVRFTDEMAEMIEETVASGSLVTKSSSVNEVFERLGVTSLERLFPYAGEFEERTRREGLHCWYRVGFDQSVPFTRSEASFTSLDGVEVFEPERVISVNAFFNDRYFSEQWNLYNAGSRGSNYAAGCDINVLPVWKEYTTGDPSVIVGLTDTGIDYAHEDLAANYLGGYNFYDRDTVITAGDHGTHVAGILAAVNNNSRGVCGVAGGNSAEGRPGVGLLCCQIFPTDGRSGSASGASAIKWEADHGAIISQNSWGYTYDTETEAREAALPGSLKAAIDYFIEYAGCDNDGNQLPDSPMKGGIVLFSAGNYAQRYNPIGEYDPVISVGAVAADFNRAYYSNYGDWVDICAPGGDRNKTTEVMSTLPNSRYGLMQGTSMACPHVSGVAALVISYCGGPGYTSDTLREQILGGANSSATSPVMKIGPLVDALGAVTYGSNAAPARVESYEAAAKDDEVSLSWQVTTDDRGVRAYGYKVFVTREESWLEGINYDASIPGIFSESFPVGDLEAGETMNVTLSGLGFDPPYYVMIVGYSYNQVYSLPSEVKELRVNRPPKVIKGIDDFVIDALGEELTLDLGDCFNDPDGDELVYVAASSDLSVVQTEVSGDHLILKSLKRGFADVSVSGNDGDGLSAGFGFQVYVQDPADPVELSSTTVTDRLVIRTGRLMDTGVRIITQTGRVLYDKTSQAGAFYPLTIDMAAFPPGIYRLSVSMAGKTFEYRIVKI